MSRIHFTRQFNWRMMLVRIIVNALALLLISILPDINFVDRSIPRVLFVAAVLGVLNAFIKPLLQFLTLRFIFITVGFAVVIINTAILLLLHFLLPGFFNITRLFWAFIGGALLGLIAGLLENLLGLQVPIFPEGFEALPALASDPSRIFEKRVVAGVIGQDEELVAEIPPTEATGDAAAEGMPVEVQPAAAAQNASDEIMETEVSAAEEVVEAASGTEPAEGGEGR